MLSGTIIGGGRGVVLGLRPAACPLLSWILSRSRRLLAEDLGVHFSFTKRMWVSLVSIGDSLVSTRSGWTEGRRDFSFALREESQHIMVYLEGLGLMIRVSDLS